MPTSEAQRRAAKKWRDANTEKFNEIKNAWTENNRARVNESTARRQKTYYHYKKSVSYEWATKELRKIDC